MAQICRAAEGAVDHHSYFLSTVTTSRHKLVSRTKAEAITSSAVKAALDLSAPFIFALTDSEAVARFIAKYKPACTVLVLTRSLQTARQCLVRGNARRKRQALPNNKHGLCLTRLRPQISRALYPVLVDDRDDAHQIQAAIQSARQRGWVAHGDMVVVVSGADTTGQTDSIRIVDVFDTVPTGKS
jgi:pyruvate kinase